MTNLNKVMGICLITRKVGGMIDSDSHEGTCEKILQYTPGM